MLKRSTLREIKSTFGRYLAIFTIIALGVAVFTGLKVCKTCMTKTAGDYLATHNFYDYSIISSYGIDKKSVKLALATDGVEMAESSIQQDVRINIDNKYEASLKAISMPQTINTLNLVEGRLPEKKNECVIDNFIAGGDFAIGDEVVLSEENNKNVLGTFKTKKFKIVGLVTSPLYLDYERGNTDIGNGSLYGYFYIPRSAFNMASDTHLYIKLNGNEPSFSTSLSAKLDRNEEKIKNLAKVITKKRRHAAQEEARELLAEKQAEYDEGLARYNSEKAVAEKKLRTARNQINAGRTTISKNKKKLKKNLAELKSAKTEIENGIKKVKELQAAVDEQYAAGVIEESEYKSYTQDIQSKLKELNSNLSDVKRGIKEINSALASLERKKSNIDGSEKKLNKESARAKTALELAEDELKKAKADLDDANDKIDEMETGNSFVFSCKENVGYSTFEENAAIINNIAKIFPAFFLIVAILVCMTTMTRMIDEQRSQIGVLRALGFKNSSIRAKYMFYSGSSSLLGGVAGFMIGSRVFPSAIWEVYKMMYDFSETIQYDMNWILGGITICAALLCSLITTKICCGQVFKVSASSLIKPTTPPSGRKILLERIRPIWKLFPFMHRISLRNVFRYKKRFILMVLGIGGCTALLIAGMGINTTISGIAKQQYTEVVKYDYSVGFIHDMSSKDQKKFIKEIETDVGECGDMIFVHDEGAQIVYKNKVSDITLISTDDANIDNYFTLANDGIKIRRPGDGEVAICKKLQTRYGLKLGDEITIKDGFHEMTAKISGIYDNYIYENIFMTAKTYRNGMGKAASIKKAYAIAPSKTDADAIGELAANISNNSYVSAAYSNQSIINIVNSMMKSLNAVVYVIIFCAGLLAFIVLYNLTNINIIERIREIATIKVLGFSKRETQKYIFRENIITTVFALALGVPLGQWLLRYIIKNIEVNMVFFIPRLTWQDYCVSIALTIIFTIIVNMTLRPKITKISMADSLKTAE